MSSSLIHNGSGPKFAKNTITSSSDVKTIKTGSDVMNQGLYMSLMASFDDKKSDILQQIKKNTYEINFGTSKAKFMLNDPIFQMEHCCPVRFDDGETKCHVCVAAKLKQGFKNYCAFCGLRACEKCCYKVKQFVKVENKSGPPQTGKICKHCDRKF